MSTKTPSKVSFVRLSQIPLGELLAHMQSPRVFEHLPLATGPWDEERCRTFVAAKEATWHRDGLGHWAILFEGSYVGWGGFEKEGEEWDYGLVLRPDCFGLGIPITRHALEMARNELGIRSVTFLLPPSRGDSRALERLGAHFVGHVDYLGHTFAKYRLETSLGPSNSDRGDRRSSHGGATFESG